MNSITVMLNTLETEIRAWQGGKNLPITLHFWNIGISLRYSPAKREQGFTVSVESTPPDGQWGGGYIAKIQLPVKDEFAETADKIIVLTGPLRGTEGTLER